jgi:hypothetical protein
LDFSEGDRKTKPGLRKSTAVIVAESVHNFGEMDPFTPGTHTFTIQNEGRQPLTLKLGGSSCKCTVSHIPEQAIPPGDSAEVAVEWRTAKNNRFFHETVTITTSDPTTPEISLVVEGRVRVHFGADPPVLAIPTARPNKRESVRTTLSSQVWLFQVLDVTSSLPGLTWESRPASAHVLQKIVARSGHELTLTLPDDLPIGPFHHWVRIRVQPGNGDEPKEYELPLTGKVVRRVAVYGPGIDQRGTIQLGIVRSHSGTKRRFIVKVRDDLPNLTVKKISTHPEFVNATLQPAKVSETASGVYVLDIEIPKGAHPCDFIAKEKGSLQIKFDHPRIDSLRLALDFAVVRSEGR